MIFARFAVVSLLGLLPQVVAAQTAADGVRLAVLDYVEGFYQGDTARLGEINTLATFR